jgi:3-oxoacyl-[acyl-carrier-protein] synthase II
MQVGAIGPASTVTAGHAAGASAICYANDLLAGNQADAIIALAADTLTDTVIRGYRGLGVLSSGGDGFALSEAGVALLMERRSAAQSRGAHIYGEMLGYGIASDARGVGRIDPRGRGQERAMRLALEHAGLTPGDITGIWANRLGLRVSDTAEDAAIRRVFGDDATVIAPKRLFGEPIGAGGSLNAALALKSWQHATGAAGSAGPVLINSGSLGGTHFSFVLAPIAEK